MSKIGINLIFNLQSRREEENRNGMKNTKEIIVHEDQDEGDYHHLIIGYHGSHDHFINTDNVLS